MQGLQGRFRAPRTKKFWHTTATIARLAGIDFPNADLHVASLFVRFVKRNLRRSCASFFHHPPRSIIFISQSRAFETIAWSRSLTFPGQTWPTKRTRSTRWCGAGGYCDFSESGLLCIRTRRGWRGSSQRFRSRCVGPRLTFLSFPWASSCCRTRLPRRKR